ncbi:MAG: metal-dependent hydrolase [Acidobacteria bacterium]|nr:metal-dependent hydrolase [Acidobacteriota bacterium]
MASLLTHPAAVLAFGPACLRKGAGWKVWGLGALCTAVPDLDALGLDIGIPYGHTLGHRGFSHSIAFALLLAAVLTAWTSARLLSRRFDTGLFWFLFLSTASHGVFDAMTSGGLGIAFFSPMSNHRYFLPYRPIQVSPIGVLEFFTPHAWRVLRSEFLWVVLPSCALGAFAVLSRRLGSSSR